MKVYHLNDFPEEVISHAFAKTSRSNGNFLDMANGLDQEKSSKFHEKWVLQYGHASVSEHSIIHVATEGISRLVTEELESGRLASYTEQSTRYQTMHEDNVYFDDNWHNNFKTDYRLAMKLLFELYNELLETDKNYDVARFALPLGALVNVGTTINMRSLRRTICKLMASDLPEAKNLAEQLIEIGKNVAPTLLKYIKPCAFTESVRQLSLRGNNKSSSTSPISVELIDSHFDLAGLTNNIAVAAGGHFGQSVSVKDLIPFLCELQEHDSISRAFEYSYFNFFITSDYGSYYDMKRHRMATILPEKGFILKFVRPSQLTSADYLGKRYYNVMQQVADIYKRHIDKPEAKYMLPNAVQKRYSMQMNARELAEVIRLRGFNPEGHPTYRAIGLQMYELVMTKYPFFDWLETRKKDSHTSRSIVEGYTLL
jgi:thymidylate synthase ThyX